MLSRMGSNASDQPTLSYEALSAAYESIILTETADDRELSDTELQRRKLFENSDETMPEDRRLGSLGTVPGEVASLPRNAMRLKRVTAEEEYVNTTAPREQMVLLHKTLLASGALSGVEPTRAADDVADEDESTMTRVKSNVALAMTSVLRHETIKKLDMLSDHLEQTSMMRLLVTDPGYVNPVVLQKLLVDISSLKMPDVLVSYLRILALLMRVPENAQTAIEGSVVGLVSSMMQRNIDDERMQTECCRVLSAASAVEGGVLWTEETHLHVFRALDMHSQSAVLVEQAMTLLWNLAMESHGPAQICQFDSKVLCLVEAHHQHHQQGRIVEAFAGLIWQICTSHEHASTIAKAGAIDSLSWACDMHEKGSPAVVEMCQGAIWQMARFGMAERVIGCTGVEWGFKSLCWHASNLQGLEYKSLRFAPLWDANLAALRDEATLKCLRLDQCGLRNQEVEALAVVLALNTSITEVSLENNSIEDNGAQSLGVALGRGRITKLSLKNNVICDEGAAMLLHSVEAHTNLVKLDLSGNMLSSKLMSRIQDAVLHNIKFGDDALITLQQANSL